MALDRNSIKEKKEKLLKDYEKKLDKLFSADTDDFTFDQLENMLDDQLKDSFTNTLEERIDKEPFSSSDIPDETCVCSCGTESLLCRDNNGNPKVFEREIKTKNGAITVKEFGYYCEKDRKFFSPKKKTKTI